MDTLMALVSLLHTLLDMIVTALRFVNFLAIFLLLAAIYSGLLLAGRMGLTFLRLRGRHYVVCPQNAGPASIRIGALSGAIFSIMTVPKTSVRTCSRWPQEKGCEQKCLEQISWVRGIDSVGTLD
jgi:hypothetical protein